MSNTTEKIHTLVEKLSPQDQQLALEILEELAQTHRKNSPVSKLPPGTPGSALTKFTLSPEDAEAMERAINDDPVQTRQEGLDTSKLPPGTPGKAVLDLHFSMSPEEVESMEKAIEDCERIEPDEHWLSA